MKGRTAIWLLASLLFNCKTHNDMEVNVKSEKVSRMASFTANAPIETVFPLFGAFEERKWSPGWEPELIYPATETIEEGTTFKISAQGHGHGGEYEKESEYLWIITKYEQNEHLIQYLVSTPHRFWTITVDCERLATTDKTAVEVTYTYIGLSKKGNELNNQSIHEMYKHDLKDWEEALNNYLAGQLL